MNPQSDCTKPTKKQTKALRQAQRRANPVTRRLEQSSNTLQGRSAYTNQAVQEHKAEQRAAAREVPGMREHETEQRAAAREVPGVREHESEQRAAARDEPGVREQEQSANTVSRAIAREEPGVREHETEQRAIARLDPAVRARESRQRAVARGKKHYVMACKCKNGNYLFHQPCGLWNEPCVHGCGYIHLSNSTPGTRKKCCVNGRLSSVSDNFEEGLMMGYVLLSVLSSVRTYRVPT